MVILEQTDDQVALERTTSRAWVALPLAVALAVIVIVAQATIYYYLIRHQAGAFGDLLGRVSNFHFLKTTGNIYTHFDFEAFTYPPAGILMLCPIVLVPAKLLAITWTVAVLAALCLTLTFAVRHVTRQADANAVLIAAALTAISPLVFPAVYDTVFWGQIATFLTLAVITDFLVVRGSLQGVLVGLATAFKVYPGIFIILWLVRREFRQAFTALATVVVTTAVATVLWYPSSFSFLKDKLVGNQELGHLSNGFEAQASSSVPALFLRPPYYFGHFSMSESLAVAAVVALVGLVAVLGVSSQCHDLTAVLIGLDVSVICSPVAWNHYFAFVPLLVLVPWELGWRSATSRASIVAAAVNVVPWHRWKLAGANQALLSHHQLYLSYVAQNATLVSMLALVLVAAYEFRPRRARNSVRGLSRSGRSLVHVGQQSQ